MVIGKGWEFKQSTINSASLGQPGERARKRVRKFRGAERGIVVGRKVGGRRGLPTASNANVKTGE